MHMNTDEVAEYVEQSRQLLEASPQMNEQNTKVRLVQPLLELLGWDLYSTEVDLEYTVPMGSGSTYVDYALLVGDSPVVFVEAKAANSTLSSKHVEQLQSYMRQELDVDWGILTNGTEFEVLAKDHSSNGAEVSVVQFNLDDLAGNPGVLELLSKEAVRSGKAGEIAAQVAQTNEAIRYLNRNEDEVTERVSDAVENELGTVPLDLNEQAREFVQRLVSALRDQRQFVNEASATGAGESPVDPPAETEPNEDESQQSRRNKPVGTVPRAALEGDEDATVAVYPTQESGLEFLRENAAWGFVRVGREFDYIAMYVSGANREIRFFAEVDDIVEPHEADIERGLDNYDVGAGEKVIRFERESFYELDDPIPFESKYPQSRRDTTLGKLRAAETTDDLF